MCPNCQSSETAFSNFQLTLRAKEEEILGLKEELESLETKLRKSKERKVKKEDKEISKTKDLREELIKQGAAYQEKVTQVKMLESEVSEKIKTIHELEFKALETTTNNEILQVVLVGGAALAVFFTVIILSLSLP